MTKPARIDSKPSSSKSDRQDVPALLAAQGLTSRLRRDMSDRDYLDLLIEVYGE
jgi:hypothetical protein